MDTNIHSFEQRSSVDSSSQRPNRLVVANRHEPDVFWSTPNQSPARSASSWFSSWLPFNLFSLSPAVSCDDSNSRSMRSKLKSPQSLSHNNNVYGLHSGPFPSNEWRTSKYTLINFLPKNLFEQFRRLANFYFLATSILQLTIPFSPVGPATSLLPLIFVVSTTAIKQAYEDYLRHKLDREVNNRMCHVLSGKKLVRRASKDIRVGDIVYIRNNEEIPCDVILLAASGQGDRCHVTTANLDGETSLKSRSCFAMKQQIGSIEAIDDTLLVVECERPNATLYEFNGYLRAPKNQQAYKRIVEDISKGEAEQAGNNKLPGTLEESTIGQMVDETAKRSSILQKIYTQIKRTNICLSKTVEQSKPTANTSQQTDHLVESSAEQIEIPLDINNLLLRASRLRNTNHVYGLVVYTGRDTKLAHNSQVKANKFSSTEQKVNSFLILAFLLMLSLTVVSSILYVSSSGRPSNEPPVNSNQKDGPKRRSFIEIFLAHFLLYNYIVPISLYVTLEFIKFFGTISVVEDKKLKAIVWKGSDEETKNVPSDTLNEQLRGAAKSPQQVGAAAAGGSPTTRRQVKRLEGPQCNSSDLNEDLGQVEVLFSDKTGTLTENKMRFMACSIGGHLYRSISDKLYHQPVGLCQMVVPNVSQKLMKIGTNRYAAVAPSSQRGGTGGSGGLATSEPRRSTDLSQLPPSQRPFDHRLAPPLSELRLIEELERHDKVVEFFMLLCLCSTISLNETCPLDDCLPGDGGKVELDFKSASPDEESLISAAARFNIILCKSSESEFLIAIRRSRPGKRIAGRAKRDGSFKPLVETSNSNDLFIVRQFERLLTFEFDSTRKRMSAIYRDCDNDCKILVTKGSESVLDCIKLVDMTKESEFTIDTTLAHFEAFAKSGLRTMLVAKRMVGDQEYGKIQADLREARLAAQNRGQMMEMLLKRVESELHFVGTTAVEDTLQEGVPKTIADLKEAGIKVWLLTGDKVETAVSVAYLCKLLDRNMSLFYLVRQQDSRACKDLLLAFEQQVKALEKQQQTSPKADESSPSALKSIHQESALGRNLSKKSGGSGFHSFLSLKRTKSSGSTRSELPSEPVGRFALIADGRSLHYAMKYAKSELEYLAKHCQCVLGCRLSPLQKAEVVEMIKSGSDRPITAAIGDGANDVSMIQEAHVGIGISGKEGRQAVNSSDFAINRFYMLGRLFFIHGHLFYHRTANTIHYFFYKNILFIVPQFIYSLYNQSSARSLYHPIMLVSYNLIFTSMPILLYGLSEISISKQLLESYPRLYQINRRNSKMRLSVFITWLAIGAIQASMAFYLMLFNWAGQTPLLGAGVVGSIGFSTILFFALIYTATLKLYFIAKSHSLSFNLSAILSVAALPGVFYVASLFDLSPILTDNSLHHHILPLLAAPPFWLLILSITMATILPDLIFYVHDLIDRQRILNSVVIG